MYAFWIMNFKLKCHKKNHVLVHLCEPQYFVKLKSILVLASTRHNVFSWRTTNKHLSWRKFSMNNTLLSRTSWKGKLTSIRLLIRSTLKLLATMKSKLQEQKSLMHLLRPYMNIEICARYKTQDESIKKEIHLSLSKNLYLTANKNRKLTRISASSKFWTIISWFLTEAKLIKEFNSRLLDRKVEIHQNLVLLKKLTSFQQNWSKAMSRTSSNHLPHITRCKWSTT